MAKRRKPGRPGANPADLPDKTIPGEKKSPGRDDRLAQELRGNLKKRRVQTNARRSQSSQRGK
ncbi:MAG: hypothetical protein O3B76_01725 [Proteobacteria bacterium]|nr:hypothetical protein [Pseudomonadota bacterium]MDA1022744.1 hypothetical protein [Pseudomonadota bacterium]